MLHLKVEAKESPPSSNAHCDNALVGHWRSEGDNSSEDGELEAFIDADCNLRVDERKADGVRHSTKTPLRSDRVGGERYLWFDAEWSQRTFEIDASALDAPGDVYLFSYGMKDRDRLMLHPPRHRAIAHRVLDKDIGGEVLARENSLTVRIAGDSETVAALLRKYRWFDLKHKIGFRRVAGDDSPPPSSTTQ